jgi:hypothetical protein
MAELADLLRIALGLSLEDRAALAERLLASLDSLSEEEAEKLWTTEAARRLEELREGRARAYPALEVHEDAKRLLK